MFTFKNTSKSLRDNLRQYQELPILNNAWLCQDNMDLYP